MSPLRGIAALIAVLALALAVAGPASAKPKQQVYTAKLNCGSGTVTVASGADLFAPLVQRKTGRRYYPVYWNVKAHGHVIKQTKRGGWRGHAIKCSYDDGVAVGTVRVLPGKRPKPQAPKYD